MKFQKLTIVITTLMLLVYVGCSDDSPTSNENEFRVVSVDPHSNEVQVPTDASITVVFSHVIDTLSLNDSTITLVDGGAGSISCDQKTLVFNPYAPFDSNTIQHVRISKALSGVNTGSLASDFTWSFKTTDGAGYNWFASPDSISLFTRDIVWGGGRFVMLGCSTFTYSAPTVYTSTDGIQWTGQTAPENTVLTGVTYFKKKYIAVAYEGKVFVSNTGSSWSEIDTDLASGMESIGASNSLAVATGRGIIYISTDGEKWTAVDAPFEGWIGSVCWTGSMFVATTAGDSVAHILTSTDGSSWNDIALTGYNLSRVELYSVAASPYRIVAVGPQENLFTSEDGVTWTRRDLGISDSEDVFLTDIVWDGNRFVVVGGSHVAWGAFSATSYDGITWENQHYVMRNGGEFTDIAWSGTRYVAGSYGMDRRMFYSPE